MFNKLLVFNLIITIFVSCGSKENVHSPAEELLTKARENLEHEPDSAIFYAHKVLKTNDADELQRISAVNYIGSAYEVKGKYDSSQVFLLDAMRQMDDVLEHNKSFEAKRLKTSILLNLGILEFSFKNAENSIDYYREAKKIAEENNDTLSLIKALNNIGNSYMTLSGEYDSSKFYLQEVMKLSLAVNYDLGYTVAGVNLAQIYNFLGENQKALNLINEYEKNFGNYIYLDYTKAQIYNATGKSDAALKIFHELLTQKLNTREFELAIINDIANIYKDKNNIDSTLFYVEKYHSIKDSIRNISVENTVNTLKIAYETEQKDAKILKISMQNRFYLSLLLLLLVVVVVIFFSIKRKKQLAEQKVLILKKEKQFIASQSLLEGQTAERNRLARDLHDGLGGLLVGTKMVFTSMQKRDLNNEEYAKVVAMLDESIQEMRRIAHNLMPDVLDKNGLKCALEHFCEQLPNVRFSHFGKDEDLPPTHKIACYKIAYELLSNAIKHSKASTINLTVMQEEKLLNMLISDNGVGFNPNHLSEGMGLKNIRERVFAFGGKMDINTDSNGTEISIELPIS